MKAEMKPRIQLRDADRPEALFEVDVEEATAIKLTVSVPNTIVTFGLTRREEDGAYMGSLGGRVYVFQNEQKARKAVRKRG